MRRNEQDNTQKRMKVQSIYRKTKQQIAEETDDQEVNKFIKVIVNICVGLGIIAVILNIYWKEF